MGMELCQLDQWENYEYLYRIFVFYFFGGTNLLEIGLHRLAPSFLNSLAFIQQRKCSLTGKQHTEMPYQMTLHNLDRIPFKDILK